MRAPLVAVLLLALLPAAAHAATPSTLTYRGDASHDHRITGAPDAPLGVLWATDLGAPMSYPVIAEGLAFVSVRNSVNYGTTLYALDASSGAVRWTRANPGTYWYGGMAYDQGRLFVLNHDGVLMALAPQTGTLLWSKSMELQYSFDGPPVASGGKVYLTGSGSGGTVYALDGANGATLWTRSLPTGGGSPAVDGDSVYVSLVCEHHYAFARDTGAIRWELHGDCTGGGDVTPALYQGRVYPFGDDAAILDAASGTRVGTSAYHGAAGFDDGMAYVPWDGGVIAVDAPGWLTRWTYPAEGVSGEAPLVTAHHLFVAVEGGAVLALDRASGQPVWCASTAGQEVGGTGYHGHPKSHIGAGNGVLYVPAGRFLVAYGPGGAPALPCSGVAGAGAAGASTPPPGPALTLIPRRRNIIAGRRAELTGTLSGVPGAAAATVEIQADSWPFDGGWRTKATVTTAADGTYGATLRPARNVRYRALAAGLTSAEATVYTDLLARFRRRDLGGGRFRERLRLSGPASVRIAARRAHFYIVRSGERVGRLRASPRLRNVRPGVYVAAATLRYLRPRSATDVLACYRERRPDAWGRAYAIDPLCGRRRLHVPAGLTAATFHAPDASARFTRAGW